MLSPLALTDAQLTALMGVACPAQRTAFLEMPAAKLNGHGISDGELYQICRELPRDYFDPTIENRGRP